MRLRVKHSQSVITYNYKKKIRGNGRTGTGIVIRRIIIMWSITIIITTDRLGVGTRHHNIRIGSSKFRVTTIHMRGLYHFYVGSPDPHQFCHTTLWRPHTHSIIVCAQARSRVYLLILYCNVYRYRYVISYILLVMMVLFWAL